MIKFSEYFKSNPQAVSESFQKKVKIRKQWGFSPVTRVKDSSKKFKRNEKFKKPKSFEKDYED